MNEKRTIDEILAMKTIAVVGISDNPSRPSFQVAKYLMENGFEIVPVNPAISEWLGRKSVPDLKSALQRIEVVDIFRKSEAVPEIVEQAIEIGAKAIWMQEGVVNEEAAKRAIEAGLLVVIGKCLMKEHVRNMPGAGRN